MMRDQRPLPAKWTLLSEHLRSAGYRTFAGVSRKNHYGGGACFGFDRGFDEYNAGAEYIRHMDWGYRWGGSEKRQRRQKASRERRERLRLSSIRNPPQRGVLRTQSALRHAQDKAFSPNGASYGRNCDHALGWNLA